jgi:hypothetical protein
VGIVWPNPRFTANVDRNQDGDCDDVGETCDGTVTDNLTGLIWLANANCPGTDRTWGDAMYDVVQLNSDGTMNLNRCGDTSARGGSHQTDWRLPNVRELQSLLHYGFRDPAVPNTPGTGKWTEGGPFAGVESDRYWTSTTPFLWNHLAWVVDLNEGYVSTSAKTDSLPGHYVWPVRGGD